MSLIELFLIAIGLSMDAFTVAMCQGLKMKKLNYLHTISIAICFGLFQAFMPFLGWAIGIQFEQYIIAFDHWIAFFLLVFIGGKMAIDSFKPDEEIDECLSLKQVPIMGIATSIDALAVGVSFAVLPNVNIYLACSIIGVLCLIISFMGVIIGEKIADKSAKCNVNTELIGGIILILIGVKILIEHLFFI